MLRLIPRAPSKITVQELQDRLKAADFMISARSIQRDLNELLHVFPLVVDERDKPFGWSWHRDAHSFDLPGLALHEALMVTMVEQYLHHQLPPSTLDTLAPYFKSAKNALSNANVGARSQAWLNKTRMLSTLQPLLAPPCDAPSQVTIYDALMSDSQLALHYRKRGAPDVTQYDVVHPLAIVQRGNLTYLVCLFGDYDDCRILAMHRVEKATNLYLPSRRPVDFSIDDYIAAGAFGFGAGEPITLEAIFTRVAGEHLLDTRLSLDQTVTELEGNRLKITATVPNTKALCWWLLAMGDGVEVVHPKSLRQQMKKTIGAMHGLYA